MKKLSIFVRFVNFVVNDYKDEDENRDLWKISYNTLVPVLVKAIQEQQAQIETLKQDIQALNPSSTVKKRAC